MVFSCIIKGIKGDLEQQCYNEACGQRLHLCLTWKCQTVVALQNEFPSFLIFFLPLFLADPSQLPSVPQAWALSLWGIHGDNYFPHWDKSCWPRGYSRSLLEQPGMS